MRSFKYAVVISIILLLSITSVFAAPRSITVRPGDAITQITVRYDISQLMDEPTINGTYKWESDTVQQLDPDTVVWLKISNNINGSAFIRIDPVVPKRGEWGFNVTGSPNWNKVLVSQYEGNKAIKYVDAAIAKQFWGNGFQVVGAELSRKYNASTTAQPKPQIKVPPTTNVPQSNASLKPRSPFVGKWEKVSDQPDIFTIIEIGGRIQVSIEDYFPDWKQDVLEVDVENGQLLLEAEHGSKKTSTTYSHYSYTITLTPNPNILNVKKVMRYKDDKPKPKTVTFQLTRI